MKMKAIMKMKKFKKTLQAQVRTTQSIMEKAGNLRKPEQLSQLALSWGWMKTCIQSLLSNMICTLTDKLYGKNSHWMKTQSLSQSQSIAQALCMSHSPCRQAGQVSFEWLGSDKADMDDNLSITCHAMVTCINQSPRTHQTLPA